MKKVYLLPNIITAFALSCGLFAIFKMSMIEAGNVSYADLTFVVGILLIAAFADVIDGAIARILKAQSEFGEIFDSLSDAITFGVAPSVVILKTLSVPPGTDMSYFITAAAMIFSICGVLRLARFNSSLHAAPANQEQDKSKNFTGLPIPAGAAAALSGNLFLISPEFSNLVTISPETRTWILFGMFIVLGYFMISRWKFPSVKSLHIRVASFQLVFLTVLSAVFVFYGILHHFAVVFFVISWTYVVTAWVLSMIRVISGKRSQMLIDYEPDPDDLEG
ncbi:MAG: phosphatidylcholine/phosphatidylserine synthase [Parachlamydiales bacterium]|jgi:CDP-diacylglycerol--serine O-phosphatidyltransferase